MSSSLLSLSLLKALVVDIDDDVPTGLFCRRNDDEIIGITLCFPIKKVLSGKMFINCQKEKWNNCRQCFIFINRHLELIICLFTKSDYLTVWKKCHLKFDSSVIWSYLNCFVCMVFLINQMFLTTKSCLSTENLKSEKLGL